MMKWGFHLVPRGQFNRYLFTKSWLRAQNLDYVGGARISSLNEEISLMLWRRQLLAILAILGTVL